MKLYYFCSKKVFEQFELEPNKQEHQHGSVIIDGNAFIYPHTTTEQSINPLNLNSIKLSLSIEKVILVDRIFGQEEMTKTKDHINRTGVSFLRGNTPFKELPTFPDVSNIYRTEKGKVFMSIGDKNPLKIIPGKDVILSEWMAPISTVWHYLGVNVFENQNLDKIADFTCRDKSEIHFLPFEISKKDIIQVISNFERQKIKI